jgi:predicted AlkP superfamily pyrophosphatase or phosphodiesterase
MTKIALFLFIDALGWEVAERYPSFLSSLTPLRKRLKTILGYSSACDPSIISGLLPSQHTLWSSFFYSPQTSPFGPYRWLGKLPGWLINHHRVRSRLSQHVARSLGYTGYLQLYNVPFECLPYFDYAEKKRIYAPHGLPVGKSIFDLMEEQEIPYHVSGAGLKDQQKIENLLQDMAQRPLEMAYVTFGQLDALMHHVGTTHPKVEQLLQWYEKQFQRIITTAQKHYDTVNVYVFADHGMHDILSSYDLKRDIDSLGLTYGTDYVAMYDSTMARFWYLNDSARQKILQQLQQIPVGRILPETELQQLGVYFPDNRYGETIFLMNGSIMIAPSFMGQKQIPGMHGFHPDESSSCPILLSNREVGDDVKVIHHIFKLMTGELGLSSKENLSSERDLASTAQRPDAQKL